MVTPRATGAVRVARRHAAMVVMASALVWVFWASRPQWVPEMRLWKAVGDGSLVLLLATVALGPLARLAPRTRRWLPWRRETGIWFGLLAVVHAVLVLDGWAMWSLQRLLGYEFVPQLGRTARMEPGFGLANLIGVLAVVWTIALVATSTDRAVRWLGPKSWKWLHNATQTVFWLVTAHVGYFLFVHFTLSFHKDVPPPDWFRLPFVVLAVGIVGLQVAAFAVTTSRQRGRRSSRGKQRGAVEQQAT